MSKEPLNSKFPAEFIKSFCIDFISNGIGIHALCAKYHLSTHQFYRLVKNYNLNERRDQYQKKLLDRALSKLQTKQSTAIVKAVNIMLNQITEIEKVQMTMASIPDDEADKVRSRLQKVLPKDMIENVTKIFDILAKEHRLDNDKPTDHTVTRVIVEMAVAPAFTKTITLTPNELPPEALETIPPMPAPTIPEEKKPEPPKGDVTVEIEGLGLPL